MDASLLGRLHRRTRGGGVGGVGGNDDEKDGSAAAAAAALSSLAVSSLPSSLDTKTTQARHDFEEASSSASVFTQVVKEREDDYAQLQSNKRKGRRGGGHQKRGAADMTALFDELVGDEVEILTMNQSGEAVPQREWFYLQPKLVTKVMPHQIDCVEYLTNEQFTAAFGQERTLGDLALGRAVCHEVGLGKTLSVLAAIVKDVRSFFTDYIKGHNDEEVCNEPKVRVRGPLSVVAMPRTGMLTWCDEIHQHTRDLAVGMITDDGSLQVVSHPWKKRLPPGTVIASRINITLWMFSDLFDLVLVSYGQIASPFFSTPIGEYLKDTSVWSLGSGAPTDKLVHLRFEYPHALFSDRGFNARPIFGIDNVSISGAGKLFQLSLHRLICDESQKLSNPRARQTMAVWMLSARWRVMMSGTVVQNSIEDLGMMMLLARIPEEFMQPRKWWMESKQYQKQVRGLPTAAARTRAIEIQLQQKGTLNTPEAIALISGQKLMAVELKKLHASRLNTAFKLFRSISHYRSRAESADVKNSSSILSTNVTLNRWVWSHPPVHAVERFMIHFLINHAAEDIVTLDSHSLLTSAKNHHAAMDTITTKKNDPRAVANRIRALIHRCKQACVSPGALLRSLVASYSGPAGSGSAAASSSGGAAASSPSQAMKTLIESPELNLRATKVSMALHLLQQHDRISPNDKVILTSFFLDPLNQLESYFRKHGIKFVRIDGSLKSFADREAQVRKFNDDDQCRFFLLSLGMGTSMNLTKANVVVFLDPWFNPAVMRQMEGRVCRIGQLKKIDVFYLLISRSIEGHILRIMNLKQIDATHIERGSEAALVEADSSAVSEGMLSLDELRRFINEWRSADRTVDSEEFIDQWAVAHNRPVLKLDSYRENMASRDTTDLESRLSQPGDAPIRAYERALADLMHFGATGAKQVQSDEVEDDDYEALGLGTTEDGELA